MHHNVVTESTEASSTYTALGCGNASIGHSSALSSSPALIGFAGDAFVGLFGLAPLPPARPPRFVAPAGDGLGDAERSSDFGGESAFNSDLGETRISAGREDESCDFGEYENRSFFGLVEMDLIGDVLSAFVGDVIFGEVAKVVVLLFSRTGLLVPTGKPSSSSAASSVTMAGIGGSGVASGVGDGGQGKDLGSGGRDEESVETGVGSDEESSARGVDFSSPGASVSVSRVKESALGLVSGFESSESGAGEGSTGASLEPT